MSIVYIAHRGLHDKNLIENSMEAFKECLKKNIAIELDLQLTKDKKVVVFHDRSLKRMTGVDKYVDELTYEEIKNIKLKNSNLTIPLFKDVLNLVSDKVLLDIEIKHYKNILSLTSEVNKLLKNYNNYMVKSFNPIIPYIYKRKSPNISCGVLVGNLDNTGLPKFIKRILLDLKYLKLYKPDFIAYNIKKINDKIIKKIRKKNISLYLFTIKTKEELNMAKKLSNTLIIEGVKTD